VLAPRAKGKRMFAMPWLYWNLKNRAISTNLTKAKSATPA